jgi:hypothetical protein
MGNNEPRDVREISADSDVDGINVSAEITIVNLNELTSIIYAWKPSAI